jgi:hypothetical protein
VLEYLIKRFGVWGYSSVLGISIACAINSSNNKNENKTKQN